MDVAGIEKDLENYQKLKKNLEMQNEIYLKLSKSKAIDEGNALVAIREITESLSPVLSADRVSIWLFNSERTSIECVDLFEKSNSFHSEGMSIYAEDFPDYFRALESERIIQAIDAFTDPATHEFADVYLKKQNIISMLDAPIRVAGELVGVVCNEYYERKEWAIEEIYFLGTIADLVSRILESEKRKDAVEESQLIRRNLETLVITRTSELTRTKEQIDILEMQRNGDYYLTSLVEVPLCANRNRSTKVSTEFFLRQHNKVQFRNHTVDVGGDISITGNLYFQNYSNRYIAFINADAMGKSLQGASGAIVLGTAFNQILYMAAGGGNILQISPGEWLEKVYRQLNYLFQAFNGSMLVSCVMGLIGEKEGDLYLINCDHPSPILLRDGSANFLFNPLYVPKLGASTQEKVEAMSYTLLPGDVLIVGSDGKDEIKIQKEEQEEINDKEDLFLEILETTKGDLQETVIKVEEQGKIVDDFSLLKISFHPEKIENTQLRSNEYLAVPFKKVMEMMKQKDFERALPFVLSYSQAEPENPKVWNALGVIYFQEKKLQNAELAFLKALELAPENMEVKLNLDKLRSKLIVG